MSAQFSEQAGERSRSFAERVGRSIPDPVIIFIILYLLCSVGSWGLSGFRFSLTNGEGESVHYVIRSTLTDQGIRWMFDNALLQNWLAFGNGLLGMMLIVMLGVGVAQESGLLAALFRRAVKRVNERLLPFVLVFLGVLSGFASEIGFLVLVPLAGLLYAGLEKNPLIGMAAAFAGVSAGLGASLIPATPADVIVGVNARLFAENQSVPFVRVTGKTLTASTMHYWFNCFFDCCVVIGWRPYNGSGCFSEANPQEVACT